MSERDETAMYTERGDLIAYVTGCPTDFRVVDTREPAPTEQEMMIARLNARLREGGWRG